MKKTEFLNTKYPSCSHKFQNLNGENFTKKTGNIHTDNENPFVKFDRRVPDAQGFHGNEHTTGAMGTRDGHVTEVVDCQMQASQGAIGVQQKADIDFPTPPPTPQKLMSNGKSAFPLFDSLLREGVSDQPTEAVRIPATAPILHVHRNTKSNQSYETEPLTGVRNPQISQPDISDSSSIINAWHNTRRMSEENKESNGQLATEREVSGKHRQDENLQPITLQDPPKQKLKRQLSIGTVETSERERALKRSYVPKNIPTARPTCTEPSWLPYIDPKPDEVDGDSSSNTDVTDPKHDPSSVYKNIRGNGSEVFINPLQSPQYFNMKDIELTSPFLNPLSSKTRKSNESIFIFPESNDCRVSPVKHSPSKSASASITQATHSFATVTYEEAAQKQTTSLTSSSQSQRPPANVSHSGHSYPMKYMQSDNQHSIPDYVTPEGFRWPKIATVPETMPFSPRPVTAAPTMKPNYPMPQPEPPQRIAQHDEIEKLQERITLLEREYERAKEIYLPKPMSQREFSPCSRELQEILRRGALRSISDIDRSPNEKDIRRINEEVKNRYERSVSDPTFSPRQRQQRFMAQPSPLGRQNSSLIDAENSFKDSQGSYQSPSYERWNDVWSSEARRQLFSREDIQPSLDPLPTPSPESVFLEDIQLPDEVAKFFHSKSFHPEDLENLKGILKRSQEQPQQQQQHQILHQQAQERSQHFERRIGSTMPQDILHSQTSPNGSYREREGQENLVAKFENLRRFIGSPLLSNAYGDITSPIGSPLNRNRKIGDIDVRISCEGITQKVRQAKEILKDLDHSTEECKCALIEQEILTMTNEAFARIRRMDATKESFLQFSKELTEANTNVYKSLEILCGIKCMCKYGRTLDEIYSGSIVFRFNCPNIYALDDLWESYKSGDLEKLIKETFVTKELKDKYNADDIKLKVTISWEEFKKCKKDLEMIDNGPVGNITSPSPAVQVFSPSGVIHARSRSEPIVNTISSCGSMLHKPTMSPFRERICSDSTVELSPRRAFQEINVGKESRLSVSPSRKSLLEIFAECDPKRSPKLSPRRKSFGIKPPWEHENIKPEHMGSPENMNQRISDV